MLAINGQARNRNYRTCCFPTLALIGQMPATTNVAILRIRHRSS